MLMDQAVHGHGQELDWVVIMGHLQLGISYSPQIYRGGSRSGFVFLMWLLKMGTAIVSLLVVTFLSF